MHRSYRTSAAALLAGLALVVTTADPASAQRPGGGSHPGDGDWSVMFTAFEPDALTHFGLFRMFGDRLNVGLEAELNWADGTQRVQQGDVPPIRAEGTTWTFLVGPSVRWYGLRMGPVSPFLRARLGMGWGSSDLDVNDNRQTEEESSRLTASLAIGAEWYALRWLGVAGFTGLAYERTDTESVNHQSQTNFEGMTQNLRTFRSGLVVNFYFR